MEMAALKAKAKEKKNQTVTFIRHHWKGILFWGVISAGSVGILWYISTQHSDKEIEFLGVKDNEKFDLNLNVEIQEGQDNPTYMKEEPSKKFIGDIDVSGSRLKVNEKQFLERFSEQYDKFREKERTINNKYDSWCSDGRYTRYTETKHSFGDDKKCIVVEENYYDDDGQSGCERKTLENGRGIINYFKVNRNSHTFDDVRDILDILQ